LKKKKRVDLYGFYIGKGAIVNIDDSLGVVFGRGGGGENLL